MYPRISIVTINLNNARFLEETIQSVLLQGYPELEYIVIDGGSTDGSVDIIRKYEGQLAFWLSEKDNGYGDALQKGFSHATGEIMAWLNSDDIYYPACLFQVAKVFSLNPKVKWLTGYPSWVSAKGYRLGEMPNLEYLAGTKRYGLYLKYSRWSRIRFLSGDYRSIQQESTFWRRELWEKSGARFSNKHQLAVDTELWCRFFNYEQLYTVPCIFGGFRWSGAGQLTNVLRDPYLRECEEILSAERASLTIVQRLMLRLRFSLSRMLKPFYYLDLPPKRLYEKLLSLPPAVTGARGFAG